MRSLALALAVAGGLAGQGRVSDYDVVWTSPSRDASGSMPLGNGDIGLNVWVADGALRFYVSKTDAWNRNCQLLKVGRVRVSMEPNPFEPGATFRQRLDLAEGEVEIEAGDVQIRILVQAGEPTIRVEAESGHEITLEAAVEPWRLERRRLSGVEERAAYGLHGRRPPYEVWVDADTVVRDEPEDRVIWFHRNEHSIWGETLAVQGLGALREQLDDPLLHRTFGAVMSGPGLVRMDPRTIRSRAPAKAHRLQVYVWSSTEKTAQHWLQKIRTQESSGAARSARDLAVLDRIHRDWWREFWSRSWIEASGSAEAEAVTRGYVLQRFIHACGGRGQAPIKFNGSIFTVDVRQKTRSAPAGLDADFRDWGGAYWWQNTRLPYWSMLAAGDLDLMAPLFRMYADALPLARWRTQRWYGHGGAFFPETMYFWGTHTNANYGWDRQGKPDGLTDNRYIRYEWQGGLELLAMALARWQITRDRSFLRETLLPLATEVLRFYGQHYPEDERGKMRIEPAQALETWWDCRDPMPEVAGLRWVVPRLLALPDGSVPGEVRAEWERLAGALPELPIGEAEGQRFLLPAARFGEKRNVENPELYAVFPYRHFGFGRPALDIGVETYRRKRHGGTGGWNQNPIQAACLGLTEEACRLVVENFTTKHTGSRFPAFWGPNYDWVPDQDHGSVAMIALQKMVLQSVGDRLHVLPAWPRAWDLRFRLHAPGKTVVTGEWRGGEWQHLDVTPESRRADVSR